MNRRRLIRNMLLSGSGIALVGCGGNDSLTSPTLITPQPSPLAQFPGTPFDESRTLRKIVDWYYAQPRRVQFVEAIGSLGYNFRTVRTANWGEEIIELAGYNPRNDNPDFGFIFSLRGIHFDINAFDPRLEVDMHDRVTVYVAR